MSTTEDQAPVRLDQNFVDNLASEGRVIKATSEITPFAFASLISFLLMCISVAVPKLTPFSFIFVLSTLSLIAAIIRISTRNSDQARANIRTHFFQSTELSIPEFWAYEVVGADIMIRRREAPRIVYLLDAGEKEPEIIRALENLDIEPEKTT